MRLKAFLFMLYTLSAMIICFLPLYLDLRGFDKVEIGIAMGVALALGTLSNLAWGMLSDKWQTMRTLLLLLLLAQLVAALFLFIGQTFWTVWLALQVFFILYTPLASLSDSLIMNVTQQTGESYVSYRLWGSLGFAGGAVGIGYWLQATDLAQLWWLYGVFAICTIVLGLSIPERRPEATAMRLTDLRSLFLNRALWLFLGYIFVLALSHRTNDHYLGLFLQQLGAGEALIGWSWLASALAEIPVFLLLAKYGNRFKTTVLLAIASVMYAVRFVLMSVVTVPELAVAVQLLHSVTFGIFLYAAIAWLQAVVPESLRATGQALFTITWVSISGISASFVGGWLFAVKGASFMYLCAAVLALLAAGAFAHMSRQEKKRQVV
jgi:PPP family 3-phenylpropionic acid transporter